MNEPAVSFDTLRVDSLAYLAPRFRVQIDTILDRMRQRGQPAVVRETIRLAALQHHYFATGASKADDVWSSWHAYGLACDVVHETALWDAPAAFWTALGEEAGRVGAAWGGLWKSIRDTPHVQFGPGLRPSPSDRARTLVAHGGIYAVWDAVGAVGLTLPSQVPNARLTPA